MMTKDQIRYNKVLPMEHFIIGILALTQPWFSGYGNTQ